MNRKISVGMAVSIVILAMTVTFSITMLVAMRLFDSTVSSVKEKESMYNKIAEVDRYVRSNDYYPIDETTLYDRLTAGYLLGTGDKYARYFSATAYTELMNTQNGTLIGIGVELAVDQSGYAKVIKVYDESPAKEAGIQVGNYITVVDGTDVKSMSSVDAIQTRLRGVFGIVHHHLGKRLFDPQLPLHALLIGRGELGHGDEQRAGAAGPGEALQRGGHHGGGTGGVEVHDVHVQRGQGGHGLFHGVGNVVELQVEEDLMTASADIPHYLRPLGVEKLHADLDKGLFAGKAIQKSQRLFLAVEIQCDDNVLTHDVLLL